VHILIDDPAPARHVHLGAWVKQPLRVLHERCFFAQRSIPELAREEMPRVIPICDPQQAERPVPHRNNTRLGLHAATAADCQGGGTSMKLPKIDTVAISASSRPDHPRVMANQSDVRLVSGLISKWKRPTDPAGGSLRQKLIIHGAQSP
jgi:hypothetical protein